MVGQSLPVPWTCPGCDVTYKIPAGRLPPAACPACRKAAESQAKAPQAAMPLTEFADARPIAITLPSRFGTWIGSHPGVAVALLLGICAAAIVGNGIAPTDSPDATAATADLNKDNARKDAAIASLIPLELPAELTVLKTSHRDSEDGRLRRRWLDAVYRGKLDRTSIEIALKEAYECYKAELEASRPRPRQWMIQIRFATSEVGAQHGEVLASVNTSQVGELPDWPPPDVMIQVRDDGTRPSEREVELYEIFTALSKKATESAESEFLDADGILRIPRGEILRIDTKEKSELRRLREELFSRGEISEDELDRAFWKCQLWWMGGDASDAAIDRVIESGRDR